jgi:hypothetical protein
MMVRDLVPTNLKVGMISSEDMDGLEFARPDLKILISQEFALDRFGLA